MAVSEAEIKQAINTLDNAIDSINVDGLSNSIVNINEIVGLLQNYYDTEKGQATVGKLQEILSDAETLQKNINNFLDQLRACKGSVKYAKVIDESSITREIYYEI